MPAAQRQVVALETSLPAGVGLAGAARQVWFVYLAATGMLDGAFARYVLYALAASCACQLAQAGGELPREVV